MAGLKGIRGLGQLIVLYDAAADAGAKSEKNGLATQAMGLVNRSEGSIVGKINRDVFWKEFLNALAHGKTVPTGEVVGGGGLAVFDNAREGGGDGAEFFAARQKRAEVLREIINKLFRVFGGGELIFAKHFTPVIKEGEKGFGAANINA